MLHGFFTTALLPIPGEASVLIALGLLAPPGIRPGRSLAFGLLFVMMRPLIVLLAAMLFLTHVAGGLDPGPLAELFPGDSSLKLYNHRDSRNENQPCQSHARIRSKDFRYGEDGISTREAPTAEKPCLLVFRANVSPPYLPGTVAALDTPEQCVVTYTPQYGPGHWSLTCPGLDGDATKDLVADYARTGQTSPGILIHNPKWRR